MSRVSAAGVLLLFCGAVIASGDNLNSYFQTNLVSDLSGVAVHQQAGLLNPWGLAASSGSPIWVADNHTALSTFYNGSGTQVGQVGVPDNPTGIVFNSTSGFGGSHFIFGTEGGVIAGWPGGAAAVQEATGGAGSIYKGLGINTAGGLLYAANFGTGRVDVYNSDFSVNTTLSNRFIDPGLPAGYAPFNVSDMNGQLYVTYAKPNGTGDETVGAGFGLVDVFDVNGNFVKRLASGGTLNAPWGLALAPSGFGAFSGDLLVGNFGDGTINAFDPNSDAFLGQLDDVNGNPIAIPGLWGLLFGNGAQNQGMDTLYFAAGIPGTGEVEDHGLYGSLNAAPEPGALPLTCAGMAILLCGGIRRALRRKTVAV